MTYLSYICTTREGETFITKNYAEALACRDNGGTFKCHYEEVKTY